MSYTEQDLRDALHQGAARGAITRPVRRGRAGALLAVCAVAAVLVTGVAMGRVAFAPGRPGGHLSVRPSAVVTSTGSSDSSARPDRPPRLTLAQAEAGLHLVFRDYTGPQPPPVSAEQAAARIPDGYALGLVDYRGIDGGWQSAWVVGVTHFGVPAYYGPRTGPGTSGPVWIRSADLLDVRTGSFLRGVEGLDPPGTSGPRTGPRTLAAAERRLTGDRFRAYSGPIAPRVSRAEAIGEAKGAYSLGPVDVGTQRFGRGPWTWSSVWVVVRVEYLRNRNALTRGPDGPPDPGWVTEVRLVDVRTGLDVVDSFHSQ